MQKQNLSNHSRQHPLYHYIIVPLSLVLIPATGYQLAVSFSVDHLILFCAALLLHLIAFIARDYAKKNQDRIIRAELRLRYFRLTGKDSQPIEEKLTKDQLVALRFADDSQFMDFLHAADLSSLSPTQIKQQIKNWRPDMMRV